MRILALLLLTAGIPLAAPAQLQPRDKGSSVQFKIKNLGFSVTGTLGGLSGKMLFDPANAANVANPAAAIDVSVDAATINTDNNMRDDHLRGESFFDVTKYPRIRLQSTAITSKKGGFLFTGKLTIKDHTKDISFPFTATAAADGGYRFKGSFTMKRKDFDIGGFSTISDELEVTLDILAK